MAQVLTNESIDLDRYLKDGPSVAKVKPASAFLAQLLAAFRTETDRRWGGLPFKKTLDQVRLRPGELSIWAGINGDGKSAMVNQVVLGLLSKHERVCVASMEMKPEQTLMRMARAASALVQPDDGWLADFSRWTDCRLWIYDHLGSVRWKYMLALARYLSAELGITHMVIDSLTKCGIGTEDYDAQKEFVDQLCNHADATNMHIHLVCHMRKGEKYARTPTKFDIRGAGEIADMAHNLFFVYRNRAKEEKRDDPKLMKEADTFLIVDKQRNHSWEGRIALWYFPQTYRFIETGVDQPEPMELGMERSAPVHEEVEF